MNRYTVYLDLDSYMYYVKAKDEETARALAVKKLEEHLAMYSKDVGIADVVVEDDSIYLSDEDIEIFEDETELLPNA